MKRAVFLDRDGVINKRAPEHDYIKTTEDLVLLPTVAETIRLIHEKHYLVLVVSNQRGVARGLMSEEMVYRIQNRIQQLLQDDGASIDDFFNCFHDLDDQCDCRKPNPGMILKAAAKWNIDLKNSWLVGDAQTDIEAGLAAGIPQSHLIRMPSDEDIISFLPQLG
jgi:D-glycero-D-manno-heptose 1,7-bisphosphate phosphatase